MTNRIEFMKQDDRSFFEALEEFSRCYQFETVDLSVARSPAGQYKFCAYLSGNDKLGFNFECGHGATPLEAVKECCETAGTREPKEAIDRKIRELELEIAKLRIAKEGLVLPAWRPILELGVSNPQPEEQPVPPAFMNVETVKEEPPF